MAKTQLIKKLIDLAQLDIDAVAAYEIAISKIDITEIKETLSIFKTDHERHVDELNEAIIQLGGEAVKKTLDIKGLLMEGLTYLRSCINTESALKAMQKNEETTNEVYDKALAECDFPPELQDLIAKNKEDERNHLEYIEDRLAEYIAKKS